MREGKEMDGSEMLRETMLRIDKLKLNNFRCFSECEVDFHPTLTVLVAENAQGKTAILDAIGLALDVFVASVTDGRSPEGFISSSVHVARNDGIEMVPILPTEFHAEGVVLGRSVRWSRTLSKSSLKARTSTKDTKEIIAATRFIKHQAAIQGSVGDGISTFLPVVAYYKTDRLWGAQKATVRREATRPYGHERFFGYRDWSSPTSSFSSFVEWYGKAFYELRSSTSKFRDVNSRLGNP